MRPGDLDWDAVFAAEGARWFHCGGIFAALGERTADVVTEAMAAARRHGTIVSYDLNYRPSLWRSIGGQERAREVNRAVAPLVDVMLGNEEDFSAALGFEVAGVDRNLSVLDPERFGAMMARVAAAYPNIRVVATTLRAVLSAGRNDWSAVCWADGTLHRSVARPGARDPRQGGRRRLVRLGADLRSAVGLRPCRRRSNTAPRTGPWP